MLTLIYNNKITSIVLSRNSSTIKELKSNLLTINLNNNKNDPPKTLKDISILITPNKTLKKIVNKLDIINNNLTILFTNDVLMDVENSSIFDLFYYKSKLTDVIKFLRVSIILMIILLIIKLYLINFYSILANKLLNINNNIGFSKTCHYILIRQIIDLFSNKFIYVYII